MAGNEVIVHMKRADPYGVRSQALLKAKGIKFSVKELASGESYVTIGKWKGTYEELGSLDLQGKLDSLLE